jgi:L-threonylcarbamoyladenylate synthase
MVDQLDTSAPGLVIGSPTIGPHQVAMPADPHAYAQRLYRELARLDRAGYEAIFIQRPPGAPEWEAVHDRLNRMVG